MSESLVEHAQRILREDAEMERSYKERITELSQLLGQANREKSLLHARVEEVERNRCPCPEDHSEIVGGRSALVERTEYESIKADAEAYRALDLTQIAYDARDAYTFRYIVLKEGGTAREWIEKLQADADLGALVRKMKAGLIRHGDKWAWQGIMDIPEPGHVAEWCDSPEEALRHAE